MTEQDWLLETLEKLEDDELTRFKISLEKIPPKWRLGRHIPLDRLISADSIDLSDLLIAHYRKQYWKKVTVRVLRDIRRSRAAGTRKVRENEEEKSQWKGPAEVEPHETFGRRPQSPEEGDANLSQGRGIQQWGDPLGQTCGELIPYINHPRKTTIRERILHLQIQKEERPYKCPDCEKGFSQKSNLIRHQRIHTGEKPYRCGKCGKSFNDSSNCNRHEKLHLGLTPYNCPEYGKRFGLNSDLVCHQRIHTGEKPFKCFECGKRFTTKGSLGIHHRIHTGEKPFKCFKCGKRFTTKGYLGIHHRIHTGEKPFKCFECGKRFTTKGSLGIHHRTHTGEKPYHCFDCKKRFSVSANLIRHQRIHTGEKPYKCSKCEKSFRDSSNLIKHKRIHEAGVRGRSEDATSDSWGKGKCDLCRREKDFAEVVNPEILPGPEDNQKTYRVHFLEAGSFRCSETELGFEVRAAVTVDYKYESWRRCQTALENQEWMIAGPLFNIWAEPAGAVAAVHFPHFMCLAGGEADVSRMRIAHFIEGRMTPEEPTRVMPFHAVLENPSFSLWGPIWKAKYMLFSSIHSVALLYRALKAHNITLHLYLIPDVCALKKVIDDNEMMYQSIRVRKSSKTKPLTHGSHYMVCSPSDIEVTPEELEFCYVDPEDEHPYMEIYTKDLADRLELSLVKQSNRQPVWKAVVRPGDIEHGSPSTEGHKGGGTGKTVKDHLLDTLKELHKQELKEFKSKLTDIKLKEGYKHVSRCDLENAGPVEVTSLLISHYRECYAVEVTTMVLEAVNQRQLAKTLRRATRAGRE